MGSIHSIQSESGSILCAARSSNETHFRVGAEACQIICPPGVSDFEFVTGRPISWGSATIGQTVHLPWSGEVLSSRSGSITTIANVPTGDHVVTITSADRRVATPLSIVAQPTIMQKPVIRIVVALSILGLFFGTIRFGRLGPGWFRLWLWLWLWLRRRFGLRRCRRRLSTPLQRADLLRINDGRFDGERLQRRRGVRRHPPSPCHDDGHERTM